MRCRESKNVSAVLKEARPKLEISPNELDSDPYVLCTPTATYDLRKGINGAREHSPDDFITKMTAVSPGNKGEKLWNDALNLFFCRDRVLIEYVQINCGIAIIGMVLVEALFIALGIGRNGKSTFWNVIAMVLGSYSGNISADALDGKIDLIVTKSVSRFARNTVDSLTTIRQLKENGTEVYFEKENIWTFDAKGEVLLTIMSSLAQEESRSISENCTWGQRKRFADGKVTVPFKHFLGYDRGEDGNLVLNKAQAEVVKRIYAMFLRGMTPHTIARKLTEGKIKTPAGRDTWSCTSVRNILSNEKYKGDALLQKRFTVDFRTKKQKKNEGELPQYYVTGGHAPIIAPETWDEVQKTSLPEGQRLTRRYTMSGKLIHLDVE